MLCLGVGNGAVRWDQADGGVWRDGVLYGEGERARERESARVRARQLERERERARGAAGRGGADSSAQLTFECCRKTETRTTLRCKEKCGRECVWGGVGGVCVEGGP